MNEIAFPRGAGTPHSDRTKIKEKRKSNEDDLFKLTDEKKKKRRSKGGPQDGLHQNEEKSCGFYIDTDGGAVEPISTKVLAQDMLMLGCIQRIKKYEMMISLPNSLTGTVSIMEISDAYTSLLKKFAENENSVGSLAQPPAPLCSLFSVGAYVVCKIKEIAPIRENKSRIVLTMNPRELHQDITQFVLYHGMVLTAAVASVEDHGYVMDVGVRGLAAFLRLAKSGGRSIKKGQRLSVGQLILCAIDMPDNDFKGSTIRSLDLNANPNAVSKSLPSDIHMRALLPATMVTASISKMLPAGGVLQIGNHRGMVLRQHLLDPFQTLEMQELQKEVKGRILCMHPITKGLYVSLQKRVLTLFPKGQFGGLRFGDIVEEAEVVALVTGWVSFRLAKGVKGIAPPSKLPVKKNEIQTKFPIGSVHRCVVRRFKPMDNVVMVSLKPDDLNNVIPHLEDVKPGDVVLGAVNACQSNGIAVSINGGIRGFIPTAYVADKPVRNLRKAFEAGAAVSCRVLKVNKERNILILTNRASMVNSTLPIIASYDDAKPMMIVEGCVECVFERFFLVAFYNEVKGFVSINEVDNTFCLSAAFKPGQLVRCTVLASYPQTGRLRLTMKSFPLPEKGPITQPSKFPVGEIVSCKVLNVSSGGLDVEILPSGIRAKLPVQHLSDYASNCQLLLQTFRPGDVIEKVLCFSSASPLIVTMKQIFIDWVEVGEAVSSVDSLKLGMLVPLAVRNLAPFGAFVDLLYNIKALIPCQHLSSAYVTDIDELGLKPQQSLVGEVIKVDEAEGKAEFSIIPVNSLAVNHDVRISCLGDFIKQQDRARNHFLRHGEGKLQMLASQTVGTVVDFTVKAVTPHGAIGVVGGGIKAIITKENMGKRNVEAGEKVQALVLALDFLGCCIDLLIDEPVVKNVASALSLHPPDKFSTRNAYKAAILMVKEDYMLAIVNHKAIKQLVHLPTRKHFNEVPNLDTLPKYGETCSIILKSVSVGALLGILSTGAAPKNKSGAHNKTRREKLTCEPLPRKELVRNRKSLKRKELEKRLKKNSKRKAKLKAKLARNASRNLAQLKA